MYLQMYKLPDCRDFLEAIRIYVDFFTNMSYLLYVQHCCNGNINVRSNFNCAFYEMCRDHWQLEKSRIQETLINAVTTDIQAFSLYWWLTQVSSLVVSNHLTILRKLPSALVKAPTVHHNILSLYLIFLATCTLRSNGMCEDQVNVTI